MAAFFNVVLFPQLHMTPEQRMGILRVLGQVHIADDVAEGDIKGKEQFKVYVCTSPQNI